MSNTTPLLGWREWIGLPGLNIEKIKAKVDTGARSSAIHAFELDPYKKNGENWIMFAIHPEQNNTDIIIECHAPIKDRRIVSDSGGHKQQRYVIETPLVIGQSIITAEVTLTNRDSMLFRMLLGRTAIKDHYLIAANKSFLQGEPAIRTFGK
ncbi:MAG: ATP-dependent zinc protease [Methylococcales bacterium]|nr:ATP-dependent zinc protease [Methylococcales bacterium]